MADLNKNKAMIPMDCSKALYQRGYTTGFNTNNLNIEITFGSNLINNITPLHPFDLSGEFYVSFPEGTVQVKTGMQLPGNPTKIYSLTCRLKFDTAITNRLRFIRFDLTPNVTCKNVGRSACRFAMDIYININGEDKQTKQCALSNDIPVNSSYLIQGPYRYIYDIENNTIEPDIYETSLNI